MNTINAERFKRAAAPQLGFMPVIVKCKDEDIVRYVPMRRCRFGHWWFLAERGRAWFCEDCAKIKDDAELESVVESEETGDVEE